MAIVHLSQLCKEMVDESDSNIDDIEGLNSEAVSDINKDSVINHLCKLKFMEMGGIYEHNIEISLTFTYVAEPESICNVNECNFSCM